jgi:hypothetical protein
MWFMLCPTLILLVLPVELTSDQTTMQTRPSTSRVLARRCAILLSPTNIIFTLYWLQIAPYLSLFINCTGWAPSFPRVMSNEQLAIALEAARAVGLGRMASIGDISCDIEVRQQITVCLAFTQVVCRVVWNFWNAPRLCLRRFIILDQLAFPAICRTCR